MASLVDDWVWISSTSSHYQIIIHISHNPVEHQHTKHIELHMHFIHQLIQDGVLSLEYIPTDTQVIDIFTKPLASPCYLQLQSTLGVTKVVLGGSCWGLPSFMFSNMFCTYLFWGRVFPMWFSFFPHFLRLHFLCICTWVPFLTLLLGPILHFILAFCKLKCIPLSFT